MIYIELIILEEIFLNYIILLTTGILLNRMIYIKKIILSSLISSTSLLIFSINKANLLSIIIYIILSIITSLIAFGHHDIIYTIKNIIYIYFVSIFYGGSIYLLKIKGILQSNNQIKYILTLIILSPIITYIYIKLINKINYTYKNYYKIDIYIKNKKTSLTAYLDTGNTLKSPYNNKPIILVSKEKLATENFKKILVPYNTIDNHGILTCIKPNNIYIHNIGYRKNVLIGIIDEVKIEGADCILNKELLERI